MASAIRLRTDFESDTVRRFARNSRDADQTRRLLALALIYDGGSRGDAARFASVTLQIVRDWVVKFNDLGSDGLIDRKAPGPSPKLKPDQWQRLAELIDAGPIPAVDGVVRWRLVDLAQQPRLRMSYSFCTASLNEARRAEQSDYSVQVAPLDNLFPARQEDWVSFAADDAAQNSVTPLRRFLWRYGRDISASRRQFRMTVDLFRRSLGADATPVDVAFDVFKALPAPPPEGAVLKQDILGISVRSPRLIAAISAVDLLKLLTLNALDRAHCRGVAEPQSPILPAGLAGDIMSPQRAA